MTETEWFACTDSKKMLDCLSGQAGERKLRLFAVACCRRIWQLITDQRSQNAIDVAERYADGLAAREALDTAASLASRASDAASVAAMTAAGMAPPDDDPITWDADRTTAATKWGTAKAVAWASSVLPWHTTLDAAKDVAKYSRLAVSWSAATAGAAAMSTAWEREVSNQAALLRDIFGALPFRPMSLDARWRTFDVLPIAQAIYDGRAFDLLPILADALEGAGCSDPEILNHCRQPGDHVRGCWVLDLLLDKS
jgi:hypothetical protein